MAFLRGRLHRYCGPAAAKRLLQQVVRARTATAEAAASPVTAANDTPLHSSSQTASTAAGATRQVDVLDLKFNDPVASFKSKTMTELVRAYVVYQLCSIEFLVENNMRVSVASLGRRTFRGMSLIDSAVLQTKANGAESCGNLWMISRPTPKNYLPCDA